MPPPSEVTLSSPPPEMRSRWTIFRTEDPERSPRYYVKCNACGEAVEWNPHADPLLQGLVQRLLVAPCACDRAASVPEA